MAEPPKPVETKTVEINGGDGHRLRLDKPKDAKQYSLIDENGKTVGTFGEHDSLVLTGKNTSLTIPSPLAAQDHRLAAKIKADPKAIDIMVALDVGAGQQIRMEHWRKDLTVKSQYALSSNAGTLAIFDKKWTVKLTGDGKNTSITIPGNIGLEDDDPKPRLMNATQNKDGVKINGRHTLEAERQGNEPAAAAAQNPEVSKLQAAFNEQLAKGLDPQVAYAVAEMKLKAEKAKMGGGQQADQNNIEVPATIPNKGSGKAAPTPPR